MQRKVELIGLASFGMNLLYPVGFSRMPAKGLEERRPSWDEVSICEYLISHMAAFSGSEISIQEQFELTARIERRPGKVILLMRCLQQL